MDQKCAENWFSTLSIPSYVPMNVPRDCLACLSYCYDIFLFLIKITSLQPGEGNCMAVNLVMTIILLLVHEITLTQEEACLLLSAI